MAAAKTYGELTGAEVSLPIVVVVPLSRQRGFWLTLVLSAGGAAGWLGRFLVRRRMRQRLAEMERQQTLERERSRIARDPHDDIGAGLGAAELRIAVEDNGCGFPLRKPVQPAPMKVWRACASAWRKSAASFVQSANPARAHGPNCSCPFLKQTDASAPWIKLQ